MATNNATNTSNPITVAQGGTGVSSTTAYSVLCGGTTSTNPVQSVASVGTSGQVLTSNGAGALPTFQTPAGGGGSLKLISSQSASSSATIDFTGLTTYSTLFVTVTNAQPVTNLTTLELLVSQDGSTYISSGYTCGIRYSIYSATTTSNVNSTTYTPLTNTTSNGTVSTATFYLYNMNIGSNCVIQGFSSWFDTGASGNVRWKHGIYRNCRYKISI